MNHRALAAVVLAAWWNCPCLNAGTAETTSAQIRAEATRSNQDAAGRPLPLVSHWTTGSHKLSAGWAPERQIELLEQGHFLLPWFAHPPTTAELSDEARKSFVSYYEKPIRRARSLKLPLVFVATQWEHLLSREPYLSLPPEKNPNIVESVDRVHRNALLRDWWRKGELVPNRAHKHFYQAAIPAEYHDADRWFLLDADVNSSKRPWALPTPIEVFSLALVQGKSPTRQWLVYAHSPLAERKSVRLKIPDYREIAAGVAIGGSFYEVDEKAGGVKPIQ